MLLLTNKNINYNVELSFQNVKIVCFNDFIFLIAKIINDYLLTKLFRQRSNQIILNCQTIFEIVYYLSWINNSKIT